MDYGGVRTGTRFLVGQGRPGRGLVRCGAAGLGKDWTGADGQVTARTLQGRGVIK
jgi:hypothetical protein